MPIDNNARIDIRQFLQRQSRARYRAFVIHGPPCSGKTTFAQKLIRIIPGTTYLDMLRYVTERPELAQQVDRIDATRLLALVVSYATITQARILLVDHIDFLVHIWGDNLVAFKHGVQSLAVTQTSTVIGFILQTQPVFSQWNLPNHFLLIEEIKAL